MELTAWVMPAVQILEAFASDMRIDLGRRKVAMAQQHLHDAQIGTTV